MGSLIEQMKNSPRKPSEEFNQLIQRPQKYQEGCSYPDDEFYHIVNSEFTKLFLHVSMDDFVEKYMQKRLAGISKDEILSLIHETCLFFNQSDSLKVQEVNNSNINAQMLSHFSEEDGQDTLFYNLEELLRIGITTIDAFKMILTHELAHRFFKSKKFYGWNQGAWENELACDFFVGVRSQTELISSTGMRWALKDSTGTAHHPPGYLRLQIIAFGKDTAHKLSKQSRPVTFDLYLRAYNFFIERNAEVIFKEQQKVIITKEQI